MTHKYPPLKSGDVLPSNVLRDHYGMNADNRPDIHVDPDDVPGHIKHLIPDVERWAIPCDVTRCDWFEHEGDDEVAAFYHRVLPFVGAINNWLDSLPEDVSEWSEAAISFMYFLKAHGEAYQPTPEEIEERDRKWAEHQARRKREQDVSDALSAFKAAKYRYVVSLLQPHQGALEGSQLAKLKFAIKKTQNET